MDKYLLEILKSVNTIIIPGLGALTITNHDTGEIMFMSYLKHDDGKLTQYIVENEGFEELDAKNLIAKYVREIQLTLDKGESYDMFQFGSFVKDGDEIDFKSWEGSNINEVTSTQKTEEVIENIEEVPEVITPVNTEENISTDSTTSVIEPPINEKETEEAPIEKIEPIIVHLEEEIETPKKELNILEKEERAATAAKLEKLKSEKDKPVKQNSKGLGFWMLMTLLILMAAGGTYFGMNYDRLKQHIPFLADASTFSTGSNTTASSKNVSSKNEKSDADEQQIDNSEQSINNEEEIIEEPFIEEEVQPVKEVEEKVKTPPTSSGSDLPFHIIAGAFSSEANATRLGDKLRSEGYTVKVGPGRGMNLVSIKSFSTRNEAQQGLNDLKSVAPNGWVYEWK